MRALVFLVAATAVILSHSVSYGASTNDEVFGTAALRELQNLAIASVRSERAAKDADRLGCLEANEKLHRAAHEALTYMHLLSYVPFTALDSVTRVLRTVDLSPNGCVDDFVVRANLLPMVAGQAIFGLRIANAIGNDDWYQVNSNGNIEANNPLRYALSLIEQRYSWVDVRPKGMVFIGVPDWKAEMASHNVADPAIENSGINLKSIEVDYRKASADDNRFMYFYRTRELAEAAEKYTKEAEEQSAKEALALNISVVEWNQKIMSLSYMVTNKDTGFKLVYAVCKRNGKNAVGENACKDDGSHDWSDDRSVPYHWFADLRACEDAGLKLITSHPSDVSAGRDDSFTTSCVPAPKTGGHSLKGYKLMFALTPPDAGNESNIYADWIKGGKKNVIAFKNFDACYDAMDSIYSKVAKDLAINTENINLVANCVRAY